jgi:hypothetical protein
MSHFKSPQEEQNFIVSLAELVAGRVRVLRTDFVIAEYKEQYRLHPGDKLFMVRFYVEEARCDNEYRFFETAMRNVIVPEIAAMAPCVWARVQKILNDWGIPRTREQRKTSNRQVAERPSRKEVLEKQRAFFHRKEIEFQAERSYQDEMPLEPIASQGTPSIAHVHRDHKVKQSQPQLIFADLVDEVEEETSVRNFMLYELGLKRHRRQKRFNGSR